MSDPADAQGTSVYVQDDIWHDLYATEVCVLHQPAASSLSNRLRLCVQVERVEAAECDLITACQANEMAVLERVLTLLPDRALEENVTELCLLGNIDAAR